MRLNKVNELEFLSTLFDQEKIKDYDRWELIYSENESPEALYYLESGLVGLVKVSKSGNENLLRIFKQDELFGHRSLFAGEAYHASAKCLEKSRLRMIPKEEVMKAFAENPEAYQYLAKYLAKELGRAENRSFIVSESHIVERVAYALLYFKKVFPEHMWTRQEIANYCATRTPTVIKVLGDLEKMNLICQNRRQIEVLDESKLIQIAEEGAIF